MTTTATLEINFQKLTDGVKAARQAGQRELADVILALFHLAHEQQSQTIRVNVSIMARELSIQGAKLRRLIDQLPVHFDEMRVEWIDSKFCQILAAKYLIPGRAEPISNNNIYNNINNKFLDEKAGGENQGAPEDSGANSLPGEVPIAWKFLKFPRLVALLRRYGVELKTQHVWLKKYRDAALIEAQALRVVGNGKYNLANGGFVRLVTTFLKNLIQGTKQFFKPKPAAPAKSVQSPPPAAPKPPPRKQPAKPLSSTPAPIKQMINNFLQQLEENKRKREQENSNAGRNAKRFGRDRHDNPVGSSGDGNGTAARDGEICQGVPGSLPRPT